MIFATKKKGLTNFIEHYCYASWIANLCCTVVHSSWSARTHFLGRRRSLCAQSSCAASCPQYVCSTVRWLCIYIIVRNWPRCFIKAVIEVPFRRDEHRTEFIHCAIFHGLHFLVIIIFKNCGNSFPANITNKILNNMKRRKISRCVLLESTYRYTKKDEIDEI